MAARDAIGSRTSLEVSRGITRCVGSFYYAENKLQILVLFTSLKKGTNMHGVKIFQHSFYAATNQTKKKEALAHHIFFYFMSLLNVPLSCLLKSLIQCRSF